VTSADLDPGLRTLLTRLVAATRAGGLSWTKSGDASYLTDLGGFTITISSVDGDGHPPYRVSILDERAIEVTAVDWRVDPTPYGVVASAEQNEYLVELYRAARATLVDLRTVIDRILDALPDQQARRPGDTRGEVDP
jgi:hypothetical protein